MASHTGGHVTPVELMTSPLAQYQLPHHHHPQHGPKDCPEDSAPSEQQDGCVLNLTQDLPALRAQVFPELRSIKQSLCFRV